MENRGIATSSVCPREGSVCLTTTSGRRIVMPTNCKVYACKGCRNRVMSAFKMRIEYGCQTLGDCVFITLTFRVATDTRQNAASVAKVWRELLRRLKRRSRWKDVEWLKVPELTKQKQPHLHILMGRIKKPYRIACSGKYHLYDANWRSKACDCLEHDLSRTWKAITGDSFVVNVRYVTGPQGAGSYLAPYMTKGGIIRADMENAGFMRRFSRSRGWPGDQLKLAHTVEHGWETITWTAGPADPAYVSQVSSPGLDQRVGTDLAQELGRKRTHRIKAHKLRRFLDAHATVRPAMVANSGASGG